MTVALVDFDIVHRMVQLRKMYSVIFNLLFEGHKFEHFMTLKWIELVQKCVRDIWRF